MRQGTEMPDRKTWAEQRLLRKKWKWRSDVARSQHGESRSRSGDQGKGRTVRYGYGGQGVRRFEGRTPELDRVGKTSETAGTCHKDRVGLRQHRTCGQRRP